jgi:nucleoside-diphosphate-sugar epimerase
MDKNPNKTILITGAAGNLGGLLAQALSDRRLHLLTHRREVVQSLQNRRNISIFKADLAQKDTLREAMSGVNVVVHFAGVLFRGKPEKFLPVTNTIYFHHLLETAIEAKVERIILISFPHVEGETSPDRPATGRLDGKPLSVHAITRLEEEKALFRRCSEAGIEAVSLRTGMVYGKGILMIDAAEWFGRHWLLGVWKKPTFIHLISKTDFLAATIAAIDRPKVKGIYHIGDEGVQTLQEFLDRAAEACQYHKPWRMPLWMIRTAAWFFEWFSLLFGVRSPLTSDFIRIGQVSYYGDTARMRQELLTELKYRTIEDGVGILTGLTGFSELT